ncbi:hypothetical protein HYPSUDRAFT_117807, partial [Hypholoma sublateritium FD-334 SS-4]
TLRRHIESAHETSYYKWCDRNNFVPKLPNAIRKKKEVAIVEDRSKQGAMEDHFTPAVPGERVVPYSDALFCDVAVQWLIETHQPLQALEHPRFREMIDVASRSKNGVTVPD